MKTSSKGAATFDECVVARLDRLSPAEQQVARFFAAHREEVLVASASQLAKKIGTSDATVIRATKALGYPGMNELRRELAGELRASLSPAARLVRTLSEIGDDLEGAFQSTLEIHRSSLERLGRDITPELFRSSVTNLIRARRVFIFGIGPSSAMANYFAIQLCRFGIDSSALTDTGLLLADGLHRLRKGDLLIILAYGRVYREIEALLERAHRLGIATMLITDTLRAALADRVDIILPVARGRADMLSMHTATLGLIEAILVGIATQRSVETVSHLRSLNELRAQVVGTPMDLPTSTATQNNAPARKRPRRSTSL